jgi:predicted nucleic acid-binding protein
VIGYFDTSAVVPLLVAEPGSAGAAALWSQAERLVSVRLVYVEARAALAQAHRMGRLTPSRLRQAVRGLEAACSQLDFVEVDPELVDAAGSLAEQHQLRGYDAVHLASALRLADPHLVLVAGDAALLSAATTAGLATARI